MTNNSTGNGGDAPDKIMVELGANIQPLTDGLKAAEGNVTHLGKTLDETASKGNKALGKIVKTSEQLKSANRGMVAPVRAVLDANMGKMESLLTDVRKANNTGKALVKTMKEQAKVDRTTSSSTSISQNTDTAASPQKTRIAPPAQPRNERGRLLSPNAPIKVTADKPLEVATSASTKPSPTNAKPLQVAPVRVTPLAPKMPKVAPALWEQSLSEIGHRALMGPEPQAYDSRMDDRTKAISSRIKAGTAKPTDIAEAAHLKQVKSNWKAWASEQTAMDKLSSAHHDSVVEAFRQGKTIPQKALDSYTPDTIEHYKSLYKPAPAPVAPAVQPVATSPKPRVKKPTPLAPSAAVMPNYLPIPLAPSAAVTPKIAPPAAPMNILPSSGKTFLMPSGATDKTVPIPLAPSAAVTPKIAPPAAPVVDALKPTFPGKRVAFSTAPTPALDRVSSAAGVAAVTIAKRLGATGAPIATAATEMQAGIQEIVTGIKRASAKGRVSKSTWSKAEAGLNTIMSNYFSTVGSHVKLAEVKAKGRPLSLLENAVIEGRMQGHANAFTNAYTNRMMYDVGAKRPTPKVKPPTWEVSGRLPLMPAPFALVPPSPRTPIPVPPPLPRGRKGFYIPRMQSPFNYDGGNGLFGTGLWGPPPKSGYPAGGSGGGGRPPRRPRGSDMPSGVDGDNLYNSMKKLADFMQNDNSFRAWGLRASRALRLVEGQVKSVAASAKGISLPTAYRSLTPAGLKAAVASAKAAVPVVKPPPAPKVVKVPQLPLQPAFHTPGMYPALHVKPPTVGKSGSYRQGAGSYAGNVPGGVLGQGSTGGFGGRWNTGHGASQGFFGGGFRGGGMYSQIASMIAGPTGAATSRLGAAFGMVRQAGANAFMGILGPIEAVSGRLLSLTTIMQGFMVAMAAAWILRPAMDMENFKAQFTVFLGGTKQAKKRLDELMRVSIDTPFQFRGIVQASKTLEMFTNGALSSGAAFRQIVDAAAAIGPTAENLERTAFWMGRLHNIIMGGRSSFGDELMRIQELGLVTGDTRTKLETLARAWGNGRTMEQNHAMWGLILGDLQRFQGMSGMVMNTPLGIISSISDAIYMSLATLGGAAMEKVRRVMSGLLNRLMALNAQGTMFKKMGTMVGGAIIMMTDALYKMVDVTVKYTPMIKAFIMTLAGYGLLRTAVGSVNMLSAAYYTLNRAVKSANISMIRFFVGGGALGKVGLFDKIASGAATFALLTRSITASTLSLVAFRAVDVLSRVMLMTTALSGVVSSFNLVKLSSYKAMASMVWGGAVSVFTGLMNVVTLTLRGVWGSLMLARGGFKALWASVASTSMGALTIVAGLIMVTVLALDELCKGMNDGIGLMDTLNNSLNNGEGSWMSWATTIMNSVEIVAVTIGAFIGNMIRINTALLTNMLTNAQLVDKAKKLRSDIDNVVNGLDISQKRKFMFEAEFNKTDFFNKLESGIFVSGNTMIKSFNKSLDDMAAKGYDVEVKNIRARMNIPDVIDPEELGDSLGESVKKAYTDLLSKPPDQRLGGKMKKYWEKALAPEEAADIDWNRKMPAPDLNTQDNAYQPLIDDLKQIRDLTVEIMLAGSAKEWDILAKAINGAYNPQLTLSMTEEYKLKQQAKIQAGGSRGGGNAGNVGKYAKEGLDLYKQLNMSDPSALELAQKLAQDKGMPTQSQLSQLVNAIPAAPVNIPNVLGHPTIKINMSDKNKIMDFNEGRPSIIPMVTSSSEQLAEIARTNRIPDSVLQASIKRALERQKEGALIPMVPGQGAASAKQDLAQEKLGFPLFPKEPSAYIPSGMPLEKWYDPTGKTSASLLAPPAAPGVAAPVPVRIVPSAGQPALTPATTAVPNPTAPIAITPPDAAADQQLQGLVSAVDGVKGAVNAGFASMLAVLTTSNTNTANTVTAVDKVTAAVTGLPAAIAGFEG